MQNIRPVSPAKVAAMAKARAARLEKLAAQPPKPAKQPKPIKASQKQIAALERARAARQKKKESLKPLPQIIPEPVRTGRLDDIPNDTVISDYDIAARVIPKIFPAFLVPVMDDITTFRSQGAIRISDEEALDRLERRFKHIVRAKDGGFPDNGISNNGSEDIAENYRYTRIRPIGGHIPKMAKSRADNCLLNIIKQHDRKIDKVYKKYPHLKPRGFSYDEEIYITHEEVADVAKMLSLHIAVYTPVGFEFEMPWHEFNAGSKRKRINIICENHHATLAVRQFAIDHIVYDTPDPDKVRGLVVEKKYGPNGFDYIIALHNGAYTLIKDFRVSTLTNDPEDDMNIKYAYIYKDEQYLFKLFKREYKLRPLKDQIMKGITKAAEHFIGSKLFVDPSPSTKAIDHNKSYVSYETTKAYIGFPTDKLGASLQPQPPGSKYADVFVAINNIENPPFYFKSLFRYESGPIILPIPIYRWLIKNNIVVNVNYWVAGTVKHVSIIDFADKYANLDPLKVKRFRNSLVGRTIAGGMCELNELVVNVFHEDERNKILSEIHEKNLDFRQLGHYYHIKCKKETRGLFHFHSFILAYSAYQILEKMAELLSRGCKLIGYHVDSIYYEGEYNDVSDAVGHWKHSSVPRKAFIRSVDPYDPIARELPMPSSFDPFRFGDNTIIIGAAGVGKSHEFKTSPLFDQLITTPTKRLRDEHKKAFENTHTLHRYIQFNMDENTYHAYRRTKRAVKHHDTLIIDEFNMFSKNQWELVMKRAKKSSRIIILGDTEQIYNAIDSDPVTLDFFTSRGFVVKTITRTPEMQCRHSYEDGLKLDSLRGKMTRDQIAILKQYVRTIPNIAAMLRDVIDNESYCNYIADNHEELLLVNQFMKAYCIENSLTFPVKDAKGTIRRADPNDNKIWWGRKSMTDQMPRGSLYEPALAVTCDSMQGCTLDNKLFVSMKITRKGAFYSAVTRTRLLSDIILVENPVPPSEEYITAINQAIDWYTYNNINMARREPQFLPLGPYREPLTYDKYPDKITNSDFVVRSEYPRNHFLLFKSREEFLLFLQWQDEATRCFHEIVTSDYRRVFIDIDFPGANPERYDDMLRFYVTKYLAFINTYFNYCFDPDDLIIKTSSNSQKFSIHLLHAKISTHRQQQREFARAFARFIGRIPGKRVDTLVYKTKQGIRTVNSTKKGQNRHSELIFGSIHDAFISPSEHDIELPYTPVLKPEVTFKNNDLIDKAVRAAKKYTADLSFDGDRTFYRPMRSYCHVCEREHSTQSMALDFKPDRVELFCYTKPYAPILLFKIDDVEAVPATTPEAIQYQLAYILYEKETKRAKKYLVELKPIIEGLRDRHQPINTPDELKDTAKLLAQSNTTANPQYQAYKTMSALAKRDSVFLDPNMQKIVVDKYTEYFALLPGVKSMTDAENYREPMPDYIPTELDIILSDDTLSAAFRVL